MDAVEFLKTKNRMCRQKGGCGVCPYGNMLSCNTYKDDEVEEIVRKAEQWSKEHPIKTRQSEFLKMFPNANRDEDGTLHACPEIFEPGIKKECDGDCHRCKCKRDYWFQEAE